MIKKIYDNFEEYLGILILAAVSVLAVVKIISRHVHSLNEYAITKWLAGASSWSVEICTYLFIYMVFIGASLAYKQKKHFAILFIIEQLNSKNQWRFNLITTLLVVVFSILLIWLGSIQVYHGFNSVTPALEMPRSIPYAAIPLGGILILIRSIEELINLFRHKTKLIQQP